MRDLHIALIISITLILGINIYFMAQNQKQTTYIPDKQTDIIKIGEPGNAENIEGKLNRIEISTACQSNSDCSWQITNCCTVNSGAGWQCISRESKIECNEFVLCPSVSSPKPEGNCSCVKSECAVG